MTRRRFSERPFGDTLTALMAEQGMTYRQLAAKAGLSAGYLNHMVHGNRCKSDADGWRRWCSCLDAGQSLESGPVSYIRSGACGWRSRFNDNDIPVYSTAEHANAFSDRYLHDGPGW